MRKEEEEFGKSCLKFQVFPYILQDAKASQEDKRSGGRRGREGTRFALLCTWKSQRKSEGNDQIAAALGLWNLHKPFTDHFRLAQEAVTQTRAAGSAWRQGAGV